MSAVTVERADITLTETYDPSYSRIARVWHARFSGQTSTGEYVAMEREYYPTRTEALAALEQAIRDQGWEIV